jgi:hypothetical protein
MKDLFRNPGITLVVLGICSTALHSKLRSISDFCLLFIVFNAANWIHSFTIRACAGWANFNYVSPYSGGSQVSATADSVRSSNTVTKENMERCGLIETASIILLPEYTKSLDKFSQQEMISAIAQDLNLESCFDKLESTEDIQDSDEMARRAKELEKMLYFCCSVIADQVSADLNFVSKGPDTNANRVAVKLAGNSDIIDVPLGRESFERFSNYGKEKNVQLFTLLSSLCTSTIIRPDIWYEVNMGAGDIPVLMVEIVSGSLGIASLEQTIHKLVCNTIDQLRLYMNLRTSPISEISSLVFPKHGDTSTGVTVVTVRFSPDSWKFCASFESISKYRVCTVMKEILRQNVDFLRSDTAHSGPWYLVKIYNLPAKSVQIASKHNIVIKQERSGGTVFLKYSPHSYAREQLFQFLSDTNPSLDGINSVAVRPISWVRIHGLHFFTFHAVEPPLSKARILSCFPEFVVKSAEALQVLHTKDKLAHLDIRTFNLGYILCDGGKEAKIVFIDLDSSTRELDDIAGSSKSKVEQRRKPDAWPIAVSYDVVRCDWRQWAMMIWSLLQLSQERKIYEGQLRSCPYDFLDDILTGQETDLDSLSSVDLMLKLNRLLQSDLFKANRNIGTSTLAAQVLINCTLFAI